ncbi:hypothetical protein BIW11_07138 [Tropilaelaps mercedesae]|uniref:Uncharacterized protein n=1 Tax=Tropilaelaps mercedesae TaxID=418985 RepID=A0A1V9XVB6_9ACAR|nr:hypothetical protein BIW11_07138 [Tropilaelaps mercedesae]
MENIPSSDSDQAKMMNAIRHGKKNTSHVTALRDKWQVYLMKSGSSASIVFFLSLSLSRCCGRRKVGKLRVHRQRTTESAEQKKKEDTQDLQIAIIGTVLKMFNQQTNELNDFTPSWLKLPPARERRPQTLHWLNSHSADAFQSRKGDSVLQKDDFPCLVEVPSGQRRSGATSAWSAPLAPSATSPSPSPTPPVNGSTPGSLVGQLGARGGNRMYKAMLPRNFSRRVLAPRPNNVSSQQLHQQQQQQQQQSATDLASNNNNNNINNNNSKRERDEQVYGALRGRSTLATSEAAPATTTMTTTPTTTMTTTRVPTPVSSTVAEQTGSTIPAVICSAINSIQQSNPQHTQQYHGNESCNQNVFPPASPCCDEAEERLLRAMGWRREELASEGPLTPEEITEATHWSSQTGVSHLAATALYARQQQQQECKRREFLHGSHDKPTTLQELNDQLHYRSVDRTKGNINIMHRRERDLKTSTGRGVQLEHVARMGADLKRALLATMGVVADSDSDLENDHEDSTTDDTDDDDG